VKHYIRRRLLWPLVGDAANFSIRFTDLKVWHRGRCVEPSWLPRVAAQAEQK